ncbi:Uncharacterised protein [Vibrio cholerae]|nr:Uncharacterised protein [Vibrio cholerae]
MHDSFLSHHELILKYLHHGCDREKSEHFDPKQPCDKSSRNPPPH